VVDVAELTHTNLGQILKDEDLAICGAKLHILPHGYRFNLKTRQPILYGAAQTTPTTANENNQTPRAEATAAQS
jgi:cyanophycinase